MEHDLLLIFFGFLVGALGTLIGAGGGFVLTPVLLLIYPDDKPEAITSISLAVTFANALSGSLAYARMKRINYRYGLIFATAAVPGAVLGALSTYYVPKRLFDFVFAVTLMIVSVFVFFRIPDKYVVVGHNPVTLTPERLRLGIAISIAVGFVSSFLGIGGGIIHVPALSGILGFPVHIATATSHFILAIVTFSGVVVHLISGTLRHGMMPVVFLAVGVFPGAQAGGTAFVKGGSENNHSRLGCGSCTGSCTPVHSVDRVN